MVRPIRFDLMMNKGRRVARVPFSCGVLMFSMMTGGCVSRSMNYDHLIENPCECMAIGGDKRREITKPFG